MEIITEDIEPSEAELAFKEYEKTVHLLARYLDLKGKFELKHDMKY